MKSNQNPFEELSEQIKELRNLITQDKSKENKQSLPISEQKLRTCDEVLKQFHISRPTLRRWEFENKLIPIRVGRRMLFKQTDIDKILSNGGKND